jgi:hypothetical protein
MPISTGRTKLLLSSCALLAAACVAGCGDHGKQNQAGAARNPAVPAADPARAARVNGYGPDGKPIDAVQAAEMDPAKLPPLQEVDYRKEFGAAPPPPPFERPEAAAPAPK